MGKTLRRDIRKARRATYRAGAIMGDVDAALGGPVPYAKRRVRAYTTKRTMGGLRGAWRALGLLSGRR